MANPPGGELGKVKQRAEALHREREHAFIDALDAERQFVEAAWREHQAGRLDWHQMLACYDQTRDWGVAGWSNRWRQVVPYDRQTLRRFAEATSTSGDGVWRGDTGWPIPQGALFPPRGVHVAYALVDADQVPVLVSATKNFRDRLKRNHHDGMAWSSWIAVPCVDRQDAHEAKRQLRAKYAAVAS